MGKRKKKNELAEVCLHCAYFQMHQEKWPGWKPGGDNVDQTAFNDLVRSATKIVAEIFTMLDPMGQMQFMNQVMTSYTAMESGGAPASLEEIKEIAAALVRSANGGPTKH
jgi:hypothetical protein